MRNPTRVLFLTVFIDLMGFGIVVPVLAFSANVYGASGMMLGLILGSFSAMQFVFSPVWGSLSDRIGRRPILMASLFGNILGFLTFAFAVNVAMLFASRILCGIAAASIATAQAYVADTSDEAGRAKGMANITLAFGLGLVMGPPFGGVLSNLGVDFGFPATLFPGAAAALLSAIALLLATFALPESNPRRVGTGARWMPVDVASWRAFFRLRGLRFAGLSMAALMCTFAATTPLLVMVGRDRYGLSAREVGYLFGLIGVVVVFLQLAAVDRIARRLGEIPAATLGAAALLLGVVLIPLTRDTRVLALATALIGVGQGICIPTLSAYISRVAPSTDRGSMLGISSSLIALARVIGPALAGLAYDALAAPGALFSQAVIVVVAIALALRLVTAPRTPSPSLPA